MLSRLLGYHKTDLQLGGQRLPTDPVVPQMLPPADSRALTRSIMWNTDHVLRLIAIGAVQLVTFTNNIEFGPLPGLNKIQILD